MKLAQELLAYGYQQACNADLIGKKLILSMHVNEWLGEESNLHKFVQSTSQHMLDVQILLP